MSKYENKPGDAVAWKPKQPSHPLSIKCVAHRALAEGEEFEVAIWPVKERKNENSPSYSGKVQDKWVPQGQQGFSGTQTNDYPQSTGDGPDDTIPF